MTLRRSSSRSLNVELMKHLYILFMFSPVATGEPFPDNKNICRESSAILASCAYSTPGFFNIVKAELDVESVHQPDLFLSGKPERGLQDVRLDFRVAVAVKKALVAIRA